MLRTIVLLIVLGSIIWVMVRPVYAQSIGGVECSTIRRLTLIERWYWIKRLGLSQEQVAQVRKACKIK